MLLARTIQFSFLAIACSIVAEAKSYMRSTPKDVDLKALQVNQKSADKADISPKLEPESSNEFFKKDYPFDKRPVADPFHFKHPYPVVQDSSDYDTDYVKDENSDNGSWKAQETYDRLRTKLRKERKELAEAMRRKGIEEAEVKDTLRRHAKEAKERDDATKKVDRLKREEENRRHQNNKADKRDASKEVDHSPFGAGKDKQDVHDERDEQGPESKDVDVSTEETEKAMKNLEECKKQLAEARKRLKELMKELEEAKAAQEKANGALDGAMKKELTAKEHHSSLKKEVNTQYKEYMEAKRAYEKQSSNVGDLEAQIKAAAAQVKAIRDSEDNSGGVYQTPEAHPHRAGAPAARWLWALLPVIAAAWMVSA